MVIVQAPASMMLMGEHAVLHGESALVCALDQWLTVRLIERTDDQILIHSTLGEYSGRLSTLHPTPPFQFVLTVISRQDLSHGVELIIESEFTSKVGFGSSAAVVVASLLAFKLMMKKSWDPWTLFCDARSIVQEVQGCGSGADVAASIYGGIVHYHMQKEIQMMAASLPLHLIYSGYKTPTAEVIRQVELARSKNPDQYATLFKKIGVVVEQAAEALKKKDQSIFAACMRLGQSFMQELGVCDGSLFEMIEILQNMEGVIAAKISGSGLGDCVYVLSEFPVVLPLHLLQKGVYEIPVQMSVEGVKVVCKK